MRRPKKTGAVLRSQSRLRHHCRAWLKGTSGPMPVQTVTATTPSGSRPAVTALPEQKLLAPRPLFTAAREVKTIVPVSSVAPGNTSPPAKNG
ncbi:conjugal transfer protein TraV [Klebsiella pneumoniae]|nr:conjugal transfer protein TraV [Klebsiella pneumoniae]